MNEIIDKLIYSASKFEIAKESEAFFEAMNVAATALEAGYEQDAAFELARSILRDASMDGLCKDALTTV